MLHRLVIGCSKMTGAAHGLARWVAIALLATSVLWSMTVDARIDHLAATPVLKRLHELYGGLSVGQGYMAWPVAGSYRISSRFGVRYHPIHKKRRFHYGLDIAAPRGTPIVSVAPGRVSFAGWRRGFGRVIEVEHGQGWVSRYAHAKKITVKKGQYVLAGQLVGQVGRSGHATGAHLHLEIERSGKRVDPLVFWAGVAAASPQ